MGDFEPKRLENQHQLENLAQLYLKLLQRSLCLVLVFFFFIFQKCVSTTTFILASTQFQFESLLLFPFAISISKQFLISSLSFGLLSSLSSLPMFLVFQATSPRSWLTLAMPLGDPEELQERNLILKHLFPSSNISRISSRNANKERNAEFFSETQLCSLLFNYFQIQKSIFFWEIRFVSIKSGFSFPNCSHL